MHRERGLLFVHHIGSENLNRLSKTIASPLSISRTGAAPYRWLWPSGSSISTFPLSACVFPGAAYGAGAGTLGGQAGGAVGAGATGIGSSAGMEGVLTPISPLSLGIDGDSSGAIVGIGNAVSAGTSVGAGGAVVWAAVVEGGAVGACVGAAAGREGVVSGAAVVGAGARDVEAGVAGGGGGVGGAVGGEVGGGSGGCVVACVVNISGRTATCGGGVGTATASCCCKGLPQAIPSAWQQ
mmetsp:Transcript_38086/g.80657  ORF Transcript_38086/g.80657 Transcript_38086/m.80657 type:complete len:239 (-) Transcript_38086:986-1702(-)